MNDGKTKNWVNEEEVKEGREKTKKSRKRKDERKGRREGEREV